MTATADPAPVLPPQTAGGRAPMAPAVTRYTNETVLAMRYWTPDLLSFRTSRAADFRFTPGHYARLGLPGGAGALVWRPFSVVSARHDPTLEFVAVLVPDGEFSGPLSNAREGDAMCVGTSSYGFMTLDGFAPGRDLWLLASGTGLGPFMSILRDAATWQAFDHIVLVHSVRRAAELAYRDEIALLPADGAPLLADGAPLLADGAPVLADGAPLLADGAPLLADGAPLLARARLRYLPVVTREVCTGALDARIPALIADGRLEQAAGLRLDLRDSRIMVCGNPEMNRALRAQLTARGFRTSRRGVPGQLAFENYW